MKGEYLIITVEGSHQIATFFQTHFGIFFYLLFLYHVTWMNTEHILSSSSYFHYVHKWCVIFFDEEAQKTIHKRMIIRAGKMAYWVKSIFMQTLQPEDMDSWELSSHSHTHTIIFIWGLPTTYFSKKMYFKLVDHTTWHSGLSSFLDAQHQLLFLLSIISKYLSLIKLWEWYWILITNVEFILY